MRHFLFIIAAELFYISGLFMEQGYNFIEQVYLDLVRLVGLAILAMDHSRKVKICRYTEILRVWD